MLRKNNEAKRETAMIQEIPRHESNRFKNVMIQIS